MSFVYRQFSIALLAVGIAIIGFVNGLPWAGLAALGVAALSVIWAVQRLDKVKRIREAKAKAKAQATSKKPD